MIKLFFQTIIILLIIFGCNDQSEKPFKSYHPNGVVEWEGQYKNGKKSGDWLLFDSLGTPYRMYRYHQDTLIYSELYYAEDQILAKMEMKGEDFKHGKTHAYFRDGSLESITNYRNNQQYGNQIFYFENGNVKQEYFKDLTDLKNYKQYHPNGKLYAEAENRNNGVIHFYDNLGNRTYDIEFKNSVISDTLKAY